MSRAGPRRRADQLLARWNGPRPWADLDDVRRLALALPETEEHISWGVPAWKVENKGFAG